MHAWVFFTAPVPAETARRLGTGLLREAMAIRGKVNLASYDRLFPSQDLLPAGGVGNLIALPLFRPARDRNATVFLNDIVRNLEGEADVTVTISPEGIDEKLMVGIDYAWAFLGLERPLDGVFQYVADVDECLGTQPFTIGHQEVDMESRYVSPVAVAADVIKEWISEGENSSLGYWERQ
jgi:hypothetical protein